MLVLLVLPEICLVSTSQSGGLFNCVEKTLLVVWQAKVKAVNVLLQTVDLSEQLAIMTQWD